MTKEEKLKAREERFAALEIEKAGILERRLAASPKIVGLSDLLFPVELIDNPKQTNSEYSRIVTGITPNGVMDLNYCSPRYELIPNADIFPEIERVMRAAKIKFDVTYTHISNVRFYADYTITDSRYAYTMKGTNDSIAPMLRVQHSYNGLTKYRIIFGYFRLVCSNGMIVPIQEMKKFNLVIVGKHTEAIKSSFAKLSAMLSYFTSDAKTISKTITKKYELLGGRVVANLNDRLTEVLTASKINVVENAKFNTVLDISDRISREIEKNPGISPNNKVTDWLVYNGINQYLNDNDRNIVVPEKRMETDSKVMEYMLAHA